MPDADIDALNLAWHSLDPWPDAVAALQRLKRRFIIAPLSNGNIRLMVDVAKRAGCRGMRFSVRRWSARTPSPQVYSDTVDILGVEPAELCLTAAHNGDLAAARRQGLSTAFVLRPTEHSLARRPT